MAGCTCGTPSTCPTYDNGYSCTAPTCDDAPESNPRPNLHGRAVSWACRACLQPSLAPTLS